MELRQPHKVELTDAGRALLSEARATHARAEVAGEPLVGFPEGWGIRTANDRAFAATGVTRTITYEVNDTGSLIEFVRHGLALGKCRYH